MDPPTARRFLYTARVAMTTFKIITYHTLSHHKNVQYKIASFY